MKFLVLVFMSVSTFLLVGSLTLSLVSITSQPDSKLRLVTAAGRFLPDSDSCEPIVENLTFLNRS